LSSVSFLKKTKNLKSGWSRTSPERRGQPNGDVSADHYNRVKSDLSYLGQLGATAYRFSIAWSRILPDCTGTINERGVQFYSDMIDEILRQGAEPFLTMYHWDLPQACLDQNKGFNSVGVVDAFVEYADVLFDRFGDRVKYWLTINEPQANCNFGYTIGVFAPGLRLGDKVRFDCMHYSHLIQGRVWQLAKTKYAAKSANWEMGLPSIIEWYGPDGSDPQLAADAGWFWAPCIEGDYDAASRSYYGASLPTFTEAEKTMMKGSCTYLALNYYSGKNVVATQESGKSWQTVYPAGARYLAQWMYRRFPIPIIFTEIGYTAPGEKDMTRSEIENDTQGLRSKFWAETITNVTALVEVDRLPVKGMLAWALLDNFEFVQYEDKFGCIAVLVCVVWGGFFFFFYFIFFNLFIGLFYGEVLLTQIIYYLFYFFIF
jgi:beta-glucosidase/6-phospho-beta-glucosidase/beta-galactosidase